MTIFSDAADVLRERGRAKGTFMGNNGSVCLVGALRVACHGTHFTFSSSCDRSCVKSEGTLFHLHGAEITKWNDLPATTDEEVLDLLARADEQTR